MTDTAQESHQKAFEAAMDEAMAMLEQGEAMDRARFDELIAQLREPVEAEAIEVSDPRLEKMRELVSRAGQLERSASQGHGQMDEVNSILSPLMGKKSD